MLKYKDMLNTKKFISLITAISVIAATTVLTLVALSLSWYLDRAESETVLTVQADGAIYIYIPFSTNEVDDALAPAVAMPYAVANGEYMDVTTVYDPLSENPSFVQKAAQPVSASDHFVFYNESSRRVQETDENGDPLFDENGLPVYRVQTDEEGNPLTDENGDPIYVMSYVSTINYHLSARSSNDEEDYISFNMDEFVVDRFYFSNSGTPIPQNMEINTENGAIAFNSQSADKRTGAITLSGSQEVYMHFTIYLANVDELMDPILKDRTVYFAIALDAS